MTRQRGSCQARSRPQRTWDNRPLESRSPEAPKPLWVNTVGGWALDVVTVLWDDVPIDDSRFLDLNARVLEEVTFPCVILAGYERGMVAIDCNDSDAYEVDDPRIAVYVKLQFNPARRYRGACVVPFTYVPQSIPTFLARREQLRREYLEAPKTARAWGRFLAASEDRFHVAHAMRRLGLPGGCYVTRADGYDDYALDEVKGRERMPYEEYASHMCRAGAMIDARGFGDLTHRTIESLGLGIPLIRPALENSTYEPLAAGVHYLDCGHAGERLEQCLELLEEPGRRETLVEAGLSWFERNCTCHGMRALFARLLESAAAEGERVPAHER